MGEQRDGLGCPKKFSKVMPVVPRGPVADSWTCSPRSAFVPEIITSVARLGSPPETALSPCVHLPCNYSTVLDVMVWGLCLDVSECVCVRGLSECVRYVALYSAYTPESLQNVCVCQRWKRGHWYLWENREGLCMRIISVTANWI